MWRGALFKNSRDWFLAAAQLHPNCILFFKRLPSHCSSWTGITLQSNFSLQTFCFREGAHFVLFGWISLFDKELRLARKLLSDVCLFFWKSTATRCLWQIDVGRISTWTAAQQIQEQNIDGETHARRSLVWLHASLFNSACLWTT